MDSVGGGVVAYIFRAVLVLPPFDHENKNLRNYHTVADVSPLKIGGSTDLGKRMTPCLHVYLNIYLLRCDWVASIYFRVIDF